MKLDEAGLNLRSQPYDRDAVSDQSLWGFVLPKLNGVLAQLLDFLVPVVNVLLYVSEEIHENLEALGDLLLIVLAFWVQPEVLLVIGCAIGLQAVFKSRDGVLEGDRGAETVAIRSQL